MSSFISTIFLIFLTLQVSAQQLNFKKLNTRQGLSHNTVYAITQDHRGFLWFGTREGLNRYDSYGLKTYYADEQGSNLATDQISTLLATDRDLYVGTNAGLSRYAADQDKFYRIGGDSMLNEQINKIYQAQDSTIYVCTPGGLYRTDGTDRMETIIKGQAVRSICNYKSKVFWLAIGDQVMLINHLGEVIKSYRPEPGAAMADQQDRPHRMLDIIQDQKGENWLITNQGLFHYNPEKDAFEYINLRQRENRMEANLIRAITEDKDRNIWLGTELGLFIYEPESGNLRHYNQSFTNNQSLSDKSIYSLFRSRENIIWIGTYFGGVNYTMPQANAFYNFMPGTPGHSIGGKAISQIISSSDNKLWIGTEDGGITIYDRQQQTFEYLRTSGDRGLSCNNVHALQEDDDGTIWIGTFLGGLNHYDHRTKKITVYKNDVNDPHSLSDDYVYSLLKDSRDTLWVGTTVGLNIYDYRMDRFDLFRPDELGGKFIYHILEDRRGDLWFCSRWLGIYRYRRDRDTLIHYQMNKPGSKGLSDNNIISAYESRDGDLWFGSLHGGLIHWDPAKETFTGITQQDGLLNNTIYGILEDSSGDLWLTSNRGLSRYNRQSGRITHFTTAHGLSENQFNFRSFFADRDGWMYFGTVNGLNFFHPDSSDWHQPQPPLYFSGFKLFNKEVPISENGVLQKHIDRTDHITLRYQDNVITFEFVAVNYLSEGNNDYAYYLEGFEEDWNEVGNKRTATYTNLAPGDYTFHLRPAGTADRTAETGRTIHLSVLPPFWQSNWAILLYGLILIGLILAYNRFVRFVHQQQLAVQMERVEKDKIREINRHKLNFFTFISHEFKTPLTLIIASIEKFFQPNGPHQTAQPDELLSIKRNAGRLQHLIHQLMEFRKIETNHASLDLRKGDIVVFLRDTFMAFSPLFEHRGIRYIFHSSHPEYYCYFDPDKLEMIVSNLVSNAAKNTPKNGEVKLEVEMSRSGTAAGQERVMKLYLSDNGKGIEEKDAQHIFTPFFKKTTTENEEPSGSGIGLALVKSLIDFLRGTLTINSKPDLGTTIRIELPLCLKPAVEDPEQKLVTGNKHFSIPAGLLPEKEAVPSTVQKTAAAGAQTLLIAEDNRELLKFLHKHFSRQYRVQLAKNGREALEKIDRTIPDLILSDAKMPVMDGVSLCEKVKTDPQLSHIPFLLLTARTGENDKMKGLKVGANAYITKPFNLQELDLLVYNTLRAGKQLQHRFSNLDQLEPKILPPNNQDREFLHQVTKLVEGHYHDPDFTISGLAQMLGISRSLLHLKMKKILKISASRFIRNRRMERAAQLLREDLPISEIAYKVGYNDPNYFSKVFKKQFNTLPSTFAEEIRE